MARRLYQCIVCGRKFPEGQGIILSKAGRVLYFHSKACATRFLRVFLERLDDSCAARALDETIEEFERALKLRAERARKVI